MPRGCCSVAVFRVGTPTRAPRSTLPSARPHLEKKPRGKGVGNARAAKVGNRNKEQASAIRQRFGGIEMMPLISLSDDELKRDHRRRSTAAAETARRIPASGRCRDRATAATRSGRDLSRLS
jgi:hypothetical protein